MIRLIPFIALTLLISVADAQVPEDGPGRWTFPQTRISEGYSIILHAPQIRSWPDFERFDAWAVLEVTHPDGQRTDIGALVVEGDTTVDLERRLVLSSAPKVKAFFFKGELSKETKAAIHGMLSKKALEIPLDLFLAALADSVLSTPAPEGFNFDPPPIHVASKPTILLIVGGEPVLEAIENSTLKRLVNANWPVFQESAGGNYYLLYQKSWLSAEQISGTWHTTQSIPDSFSKLPAAGGFKAIRAAIPPAADDGAGPAVIYTDKPAELVVIDGVAALTEIDGADGLRYVSNTESPLFKLEDTWYFLVSGRWFATGHNVLRGPWAWQKDLPEAFSKIPEDHPMAAVRASVTGTPDARMAALEASLPTKKAVPVNSAPPVEVSYAGEPKFEPIPNTPLARAANSGYDIIQYAGTYYLCYAGVWYEGSAPIGPWVVSSNVPEEIYTIPPSSPSYPVTQVKLQQTSSTEIIYTYPPSYSTGVYVVYGVPYYGTGWYYPPWIYAGLFYPYWGSYGHGHWYNPYYGGYVSHSAYYGPYGGYSYTSGYNPNTGRYGQAYRGWDGDEWGSYRETYNPRTGVYSETSRYYDADSGKLEMERTRERGNQSISTTRNTDFDSQRSNTHRTTSAGGDSNIARSWGDGKMTTSGTIQAADGRSATVVGSHDRSGGTTTVTGSSGKTLTAETQRTASGRTTDFKTSSGATATTTTSGVGNRTTVGQSASGDLYVAKNGQVYKKSGDQWQVNDNGSWRSTGVSERASQAQNKRETLATSGDLSAARAERGSAAARTGNTASGRIGTRERSGQYSTQMERRGTFDTRDRRQLDRDRQARQSSRRSMEQRGSWGGRSRTGGFDRGGFNRGSLNRGGFGGGRMGGGRMGGGGRRR